MMTKIIEFKDVNFAYTNHEGKKQQALKDITLSINRGDFIAISGSNGSGKSTFAKHINALLKPDNGDVFVNSLNTKEDDNLWDIRSNAGMVFQNPDNQIVATIVEEDVAFGPENIGIEPAEIRRRVDECLKIVEMTEYADKAPHMLSGGQKQRVAIAGVLALEPDIIILDESTAMLDPKGRREIMEIIIELHNQGRTIILITHFMEEAQLADRIIIFCDGEVVMDSSPRDIFSHDDKLKELDLELPRSIKLANMLSEIGITIDGHMDVDGIAEAICLQK